MTQSASIEILLQQGQDQLEQVKEASPLIGIMHSLKEELHQIFEESQNLGEGTLN